QRATRDLRQLGAQTRDDLVGVRSALVARLQADDHETRVYGSRAPQARSISCDIRILRDHIQQLVLQALHLGEGNILWAVGQAGDDADVLLGKETLRHERVQHPGE